MKQFFSSLPLNIIKCFKGPLLIWHAVAIALTFVLVISGFDWLYFSSARSPVLRTWMFHSAPMADFWLVMVWAWCRKRSRIAPAVGTSPRSLPHSSSGRLLVMNGGSVFIPTLNHFKKMLAGAFGQLFEAEIVNDGM